IETARAAVTTRKPARVRSLLNLLSNMMEFLQLISRTRTHSNLHVKIGPATLKTAATVSGRVVGLRAQDVFTGRCELCRSRCLSLSVSSRPRILDCDFPWTPELAPAHGPTSGSGSGLVVADPQRQRKRV